VIEVVRQYVLDQFTEAVEAMRDGQGDKQAIDGWRNMLGAGRIRAVLNLARGIVEQGGRPRSRARPDQVEVQWRLGVAEHRMEVPHHPRVDRLAPPGGLAQRVDRQTVIYPGRVVTLEQMVRQRLQQEVVLTEVVQQQARRIHQIEVPLEDATDQGIRQPLGGCRADEFVKRLVEGAGPNRVAVVSSLCTNPLTVGTHRPITLPRPVPVGTPPTLRA
jgi:hypothetical protein